MCVFVWCAELDPSSSAPDIDPYDLIDPVDILSKLPKDFYEKIVCIGNEYINVNCLNQLLPNAFKITYGYRSNSFWNNHLPKPQ